MIRGDTAGGGRPFKEYQGKSTAKKEFQGIAAELYEIINRRANGYENVHTVTEGLCLMKKRATKGQWRPPAARVFGLVSRHR